VFAPPPVLNTEVFARLPDTLRVQGRKSAWASTHRPGLKTDSFLEGPSFDLAGTLYLVDIPWGRIFRVDSKGVFSVVAEYDGAPNGLKIHRDGRVFVADFARGILELDPRSGRMTPVADRFEDRSFNGVNDLVFAGNGDLYFTDQGLSGLHDPSGRVFRLRASGTLELVLDHVPSPNGLVLDRAESTLYVNVTRDNAIWRIPLTPEGRAFKVGAFIRLSGGVGPDGLALDQQGGLAIAHLGLGVVWLVSATGEPLARINSCAGLGTSNLAFGGPDRRTLYITESETGQILKAHVPVAGWPMYSHR
jgi:gluconolactonase